jgi:putative molybdopterin biosynthesis protein
MPSAIGVEEVLRVMLMAKNGKYYAYPLPRGASSLSSLSRADALVSVPENVEGFDADTELKAVLLRPEEDLQNRLHIVGSHDLCLDVLRDMIKTRHPEMDLISSHVGSLSGILAMQKGIVDLATVHILDEQERVYNIPAVKKHLPGRRVRLIRIAKRVQGLLLAKGNPKAVRGIADLARKDVRFVNRQVGSGTRILLDIMLKENGIDGASIRGYDREESTHTATAILVKEGIADAGLAIYPVSRIFGLDFIPLREEEYDLLVTEEFRSDPRFGLVMDLLASAEFAARLDDLGGYNTSESGKTIYASQVI